MKAIVVQILLWVVLLLMFVCFRWFRAGLLTFLHMISTLTLFNKPHTIDQNSVSVSCLWRFRNAVLDDPSLLKATLTNETRTLWVQHNKDIILCPSCVDMISLLFLICSRRHDLFGDTLAENTTVYSAAAQCSASKLCCLQSTEVMSWAATSRWQYVARTHMCRVWTDWISDSDTTEFGVRGGLSVKIGTLNIQ